MDALAPPVVAVIVTRDPGPWFEEALCSFGAQDYPELSVLVLDAASAEDPTERVAAALPSAFVRRLEANRGFGASADEVRSMVDGAAYFLFCHDDVAPDPDAVHLLVEESFRSNAAIVSPKFVSWDDPERLLHVGLAADKVGSVEDRVHPDEVDHGQHDAVRDVFVAPGGCTLARADLFGDLGGFDPTISFLGEDLDLCWRAQVVGARVVVAPSARVRHREELASGSRSLPGTDPDQPAAGGPGDGDRPVTMQELQRRHELYVVLKCYSRWHRWRVLPQAFLLAVGEVVVAELAGNRARARAVRRAWVWNLRHRAVIREKRRELQANRHLPDRDVRALQVGGSARMAAYGRRVFQYGFHGAHADELAADETPDERQARERYGMSPGAAYGTVAGATAAVTIAPARPGFGGSVTGVPAPPAGPAAPGGAGDGATSATAGPAGPSPLHARESDAAPGRVRLLTWLGVAVVLVFGTRGVLLSQLPAVGQFAPLPSFTGTFTQFIAGWHPSGVGTTAPAAPAFVLLTLGGTLVFGAMGFLQHVVVFAPVPIGAWGTVRLVRRFGSPRAAFVAGLAYLAMPLAYDAVAMGRWGALLAFGGVPWAMDLVFMASSLPPFGRPEPTVTATSPGSGPPDEGAITTTTTTTGRRTWQRLSEPFRVRGSRARSVLVLGLVEALLVAFVPAVAIVLLVVPIALLVASALVGGAAGARRALVGVLASTAVAVVLTLPWTVGVVSAGRGALVVFGVATPPSTAPTWSDLLRFAPGPIGDSLLTWGFMVAAVLPLLIGRGVRFVWAARCWAVALLAWLLAMVTSHGWVGPLAPDPAVLLVPAAVAIAAAVGLGIAAFETDLRAASFGWRQAATVVAAGLALLGAVPVVVSSVPGRWNLPTSDFNQTVSWMGQTAGAGRSGSCGWAMPGPSTPGPGRRVTASPTRPPVTARPTPPGCGTAPRRVRRPRCPTPSTPPAAVAPTGWVPCWLRRVSAMSPC